MKLISLNAWGGKEYAPLMDFVRLEKDTDVFCFQEMLVSPRKDISLSDGAHVHIVEELKGELPHHAAHFFPLQDGFDVSGRVDFDITEGQATFLKKEIPVLSSGEVFTRGKRNSATGSDHEDYPSSFGYVRIPFKATTLTILNFYGFPHPGDKLDTPERLEQSHRIFEFAIKEKGEVIICGDFNLFPHTESILMLDKSFTNLIKKYSIQTTRSTVSKYYGTPEQQNFADYTFVSEGIHVESFDVPSDCKASDHLPMILEFS